MNHQEHEHDKVLAFDTLFTTNHIQMLKILMPFLDPSKQKYIAIYIKYMELQYTISYFRKNNSAPFPARIMSRQSSGQDSGQNYEQDSGQDAQQLYSQIFLEVMPYCSPEEKKKLEQMENLFSTMKNYQDMMEMISMMKELFPQGEGGMDPDMLSGLFGQDTSQIFDLFRSMNPT